MMENYILQTIAFQLAFLLVYELLLKKETFFNYNRVYLLITPVLALILPLLKIELLQTVVPSETLVRLPEVFIGAQSVSDTTSSLPEALTHRIWPLNWWWFIYGTGALISLLIFLKRYSRLKSLFQNPVIYRNEQLRIIRVADSDLAFTFFNRIFLGDKLEQEEVEQIICHEKIHVRQKHSMDLLFFEIQKIIFWFNPLVYIFQSRLSELHEYLADAGVVQKVEKKVYYQQLLSTAFNTNQISFINQFFNHSIIKKRIVMLEKSKSKATAKLKYLLLLPLLLLMLTYVACGSNKEAHAAATPPPPPPAPPSTTSVEVTQTPEVEYDSDSPIPFAVVEQVPVFPGCEGLETNRERKDCMSNHINEFVNRNFNTGLGKELGLTGLNRVYVQFKISSEGKVTALKSRAPHPALGEEAERVVALLPEMEPAIHRGEKVDVLYSLPINFMVPEQKEEETQED